MPAGLPVTARGSQDFEARITSSWAGIPSSETQKRKRKKDRGREEGGKKRKKEEGKREGKRVEGREEGGRKEGKEGREGGS